MNVSIDALIGREIVTRHGMRGMITAAHHSGRFTVEWPNACTADFTNGTFGAWIDPADHRIGYGVTRKGDGRSGLIVGRDAAGYTVAWSDGSSSTLSAADLDAQDATHAAALALLDATDEDADRGGAAYAQQVLKDGAAAYIGEANAEKRAAASPSGNAFMADVEKHLSSMLAARRRM